MVGTIRACPRILDAEFAGWLHQDIGDFRAARFWLDRGLDLADAAVAAGQAHRRLVGVALTYGAHGHALGGLHKESMQALDRARGQLDKGDDPPARLARWLDASYIEVQRARCSSVLGENPVAASIFEQAIEDLPPDYRRDRGVYLAGAGQAHACSGKPERAVAAGTQALAIAHQTGSGRIITELASLNCELKRWKSVPSVTEFARHSLMGAAPLK